MDEFFKKPTKEEIDKQILTQLCYDSQVPDDEIEELIKGIIIWREKSNKDYSESKTPYFIDWNPINQNNLPAPNKWIHLLSKDGCIRSEFTHSKELSTDKYTRNYTHFAYFEYNIK